MPLTLLGQLPSNAKIPWAQIGRRTQLIAYANNLPGSSWGGQTFTVPDEGGPMQVLVGSFIHGYFNAVGYHWYGVAIDGVVQAYHRILVNSVGHRPFLPCFFNLTLNPGSHTLTLPTAGGNFIGPENANNKWSYFVLAFAPYTRLASSGSTVANLGAIPSNRHPEPKDVDQPRVQIHTPSGHMRGRWQAKRNTEFAITLPEARNVFFLGCFTAYNTQIHTIPYMDCYLQTDTISRFVGSTHNPTNENPCHHVFMPICWYGTLGAGTWCPVLYQGAYCESGADDFGTAIAISGV